MNISKILENTLPGLGYELVDYELVRGGTIRVFMDKPGGVAIEDCSKVSEHLSNVLLAENIDYRYLEISSPGLDRPLKSNKDFLRYIDSYIKVKLKVPTLDNRKKILGTLLACTEHGITVLTKEQETFEIKFSDIGKANLEPVI